MRRFGSFHAQWFLPGRIDGILGIAILLGVCMTPIPWILEFTPPFSVPSRLFLFVLAAACGGTFGFLNLVDLYVLFGRDSMWRRFGWAVVVSAIPLLAVALSVGLTAQRGAQLFNIAGFPLPLVLFAVLVQRWATTSCLLLLSIPLRAITGWRVSFKQRNSSTPG